MEQFNIKKQGSVKVNNWYPRIMSASRMMGVLSLSDADDTTNLYARSLRITSVKGWPDYHKSYLFEDFKSPMAKLTLRIKGERGTVTEVVSESNGCVLKRYNFVKEREVMEEAWMITFPSEEELNRAKMLFLRMPRVKTPPMTRQNTEVPQSVVSVR